MTRLIVPLLLFAAAIGLFVAYTNPAYQASKFISAQVADYDDALTKSQELKSVRDQLLSKRNTFSSVDVQKLQKILPDNVDNIRLIIDINNVAARHGLALKNVSLGDTSPTSRTRSAVAVGAAGDPVGSVSLGFSVSAPYDKMLAFLHDLEHSLRLLDVQKMSFVAGATPNADYSFTIRTYWLH